MLCQVNWAAWGLQPPERERCEVEMITWMAQMCVHEHLQRAPVCSFHLKYMQELCRFEDWGCARCLILGHQCRAPVRIDNGPGTYEDTRRQQGWDIRPATLYDAMHGREPA